MNKAKVWELAKMLGFTDLWIAAIETGYFGSLLILILVASVGYAAYLLYKEWRVRKRCKN